MKPRLDTDVLHRCVKQAVGLPKDQLFAALTRNLHEAYPSLIADEAPQWIFNNAGGAMGQLSLLYASLNEYLLMFGTPIGTEGHSGRYRTQVWDFMLAGEMWCYTEGETDRKVYRAGDAAYLGPKYAKGYRIPEEGWMLEYCRGPVPSMLPFGLTQVATSTLDGQAATRLVAHYAKHVIRSVRPRATRPAA